MQIASNTINNFALKTGLPTYFLLAPNSIYINQDKLPNNVEAVDQSAIIQEAYAACPNVQTIDTVHYVRRK